MHTWLVAQRTKDWLNGEPVDALVREGIQLFLEGDLTVHHVFPRRILADKLGWPGALRLFWTRFFDSPGLYPTGTSAGSTEL